MMISLLIMFPILQFQKLYSEKRIPERYKVWLSMVSWKKNVILIRTDWSHWLFTIWRTIFVGQKKRNPPPYKEWPKKQPNHIK